MELMERNYRLNIEPKGMVLVLGVRGELTATGSVDFYYDVWGLDPAVYQGLVMDISALSELDAVGLSVCRRVFTKVLRAGRRAALVINRNGTMDPLVAEADMAKLAPVFGDRKEAVDFLLAQVCDDFSMPRLSA